MFLPDDRQRRRLGATPPTFADFDEYEDDYDGGGGSGIGPEDRPTQRLDTPPGAGPLSRRIDAAEQRSRQARQAADDYAAEASSDIEASAKGSKGRRILGAALGSFLGFARASGNQRHPDDPAVYAAIDRSIVRPEYHDKVRRHGEQRRVLDRASQAADRDLKSAHESEKTQADIAASDAQRRSYEAREAGWKARQEEARIRAEKAHIELPPAPKEPAALAVWYRQNEAKLREIGYQSYDQYLEEVGRTRSVTDPEKPTAPARPTQQRMADGNVYTYNSETGKWDPPQFNGATPKKPPRDATPYEIDRHRESEDRNKAKAVASVIRRRMAADGSIKTFDDAIRAGLVPEGMETAVKAELVRNQRGKQGGGGLSSIVESLRIKPEQSKPNNSTPVAPPESPEQRRERMRAILRRLGEAPL